jgi:hypothetical protein
MHSDRQGGRGDFQSGQLRDNKTEKIEVRYRYYLYTWEVRSLFFLISLFKYHPELLILVYISQKRN